MFHEIRGELGGDQTGAVAVFLAESRVRSGIARCKPSRRGLARLDDGNPPMRAAYFHRVITTRVPPPGVELIANSFESRLAPDRPRPKPPPVEYPSFIAS